MYVSFPKVLVCSNVCVQVCVCVSGCDVDTSGVRYAESQVVVPIL